MRAVPGTPAVTAGDGAYGLPLFCQRSIMTGDGMESFCLPFLTRSGESGNKLDLGAAFGGLRAVIFA